MNRHEIHIETPEGSPLDVRALRAFCKRRGWTLARVLDVDAPRARGRPRSLDKKIRAAILGRVEAGESFRSIASDLERRGVPSAQGGTWRANTVRAIARAPADPLK
jgi:hypothetical protein